MARASQLSEISCCLAETPSCLMYGQRSRRKRSPAYVMLTFPCLLVSSLLLCSTLPWPRCVRLRTTLLSSGPCIHRRFLGSLRLGRSRQGPRSQKQASMAPSSSTQQGRKRRGRKGKVPFSSGSGRSGGKQGGAGKKSS